MDGFHMNIRSQMHSHGFTKSFDPKLKENIQCIKKLIKGDFSAEKDLIPSHREESVISVAMSYRSQSTDSAKRYSSTQMYSLRTQLQYLAEKFPSNDFILWSDVKYAAGVYSTRRNDVDEWVKHGLLAYEFSYVLVLGIGVYHNEMRNNGWVYMERSFGRRNKYGVLYNNPSGKIEIDHIPESNELVIARERVEILKNATLRRFGVRRDFLEVKARADLFSLGIRIFDMTCNKEYEKLLSEVRSLVGDCKRLPKEITGDKWTGCLTTKLNGNSKRPDWVQLYIPDHAETKAFALFSYDSIYRRVCVLKRNSKLEPWLVDFNVECECERSTVPDLTEMGLWMSSRGVFFTSINLT